MGGRLVKRPTTILLPVLLMAGLGSGAVLAQGMSPPAFSDLDTNGDGVIDADEFAQHQAARMSERHGKGSGQGKGQGKGYGEGQVQGQGKGHGKHGGSGKGAPAYGELDLDGDGCINAEEFSMHVAARHGQSMDPE
jgi:hypothetical protein